ncbi:MAG: heat shock protein Hsp20, family protein [Candidatus Nomurabacteria bacterium]|nr:heat shock protein Hsp20, family protein [Candidatus Nomurabacteria bacterium]
MLKEKKSFFERLAGSINVDEEDDQLDYDRDDEDMEEVPIKHVGKKVPESPVSHNKLKARHATLDEDMEEVDPDMEEGELSVDVYQTSNEIIIEAMVAGVKPEDLHLSITRDMVTIKGRRDGNTQVTHDDYFYKELYWGSFTRTILLPHEVEIEEAEAVEKHGLLIIRLPKVDKARQAKLKVKSI